MPATYTDRRQGLTTAVAVKAPCRVATTANITLSGTQTVDGVALAVRDRVLVKNQTNPIATTFVTYGAKYAVRKNATPRIGRAHSSASTKPMPIVSGMLASVK